MLSDRLRRALHFHLHPTEYCSLFPRDCAFPYAYDESGEPLLTRVQLTSELAYFFLFERIRRDLYVSVYSDEQVQRRMIDTLFIDIDDRELARAYDKLWYVLGKLEEWGVDSGRLRVYFSGAKGFHVYIDFKPIWLPNHIHFRSLVIRLLKRLGITSEVIDVRVVGDWRRISRVPYTVNSRTGLYCYPIDPTNTLDAILSEATDPPERVIKVSRRAGGPIRRLLKKLVTEQGRRVYRTFEARIGRRAATFELPPCVRAWIAELRDTHELDHYARLNIAIFLLRMGWSVDDIVNVFAVANDFDERKTRYQVEYAQKRQLLMWSCNKLIDMGLCPLETPQRCPFYPSINRYFGWSKQI